MGTFDLSRFLIRNGILRSPDVINAFQTINRGDFVLPEFSERAYENEPLPIGFNQTISQPATVAFMLELLEVHKGHRILDIGSGSGYTTALLANITGKEGRVIGVEALPQLVQMGNLNLEKYHFRNAHIVPAHDSLGYPEEGPYDRILLSASAPYVPAEVVEQLGNEGRAVIPVGESLWLLHKIDSQTLERREYPGFLFVPLRSPSE